jgi:uncharacterized protein YpuA (DUF1002 family)
MNLREFGAKISQLFGGSNASSHVAPRIQAHQAGLKNLFASFPDLKNFAAFRLHDHSGSNPQSAAELAEAFIQPIAHHSDDISSDAAERISELLDKLKKDLSVQTKNAHACDTLKNYHGLLTANLSRYCGWGRAENTVKVHENLEKAIQEIEGKTTKAGNAYSHLPNRANKYLLDRNSASDSVPVSKQSRPGIREKNISRTEVKQERMQGEQQRHAVFRESITAKRKSGSNPALEKKASIDNEDGLRNAKAVSSRTDFPLARTKSIEQHPVLNTIDRIFNGHIYPYNIDNKLICPPLSPEANAALAMFRDACNKHGIRFAKDPGTANNCYLRALIRHATGDYERNFDQEAQAVRKEMVSFFKEELNKKIRLLEDKKSTQSKSEAAKTSQKIANLRNDVNELEERTLSIDEPFGLKALEIINRKFAKDSPFDVIQIEAGLNGIVKTTTASEFNHQKKRQVPVFLAGNHCEAMYHNPYLGDAGQGNVEARKEMLENDRVTLGKELKQMELKLNLLKIENELSLNKIRQLQLEDERQFSANMNGSRNRLLNSNKSSESEMLLDRQHQLSNNKKNLDIRLKNTGKHITNITSEYEARSLITFAKSEQVKFMERYIAELSYLNDKNSIYQKIISN